LSDDKKTILIDSIQKKLKSAKKALKKLNAEDKIEFVVKKLNEIIDLFENRRDFYAGFKHKRFFFPKIIKLSKYKNKFFWRKKTAIEFCQKQIADAKALIKNPNKILATPNKKIKGYTELSWEMLITNSDDYVTSNESKHHIRSLKKARAKSVGKKMGMKFIMSMAGFGILFGALKDVDLGYIIYILFLMFMQIAKGLKEAYTHVKQIVIINAVRRADALKSINNAISGIEAEDKRIADEEKVKLVAFHAELVKNQVKLLTTTDVGKNDTYTTDILPPGFKPQYKNLLGTS
jgi:hypothetical protein